MSRGFACALRQQFLKLHVSLAIIFIGFAWPAWSQQRGSGDCPSYQTDRTFDAATAEKIGGSTLHLTHALPGRLSYDNITCPTLSFKEDKTFRYQYRTKDGVLTYYDGQYDVTPTSHTAAGHIMMRFQYMNILGSNTRGELRLFVLYSTWGRLFTLAACTRPPLDRTSEYLFVLATQDIATAPAFAAHQKTELMRQGVPYADLLVPVPTTC